MKEMTIRQFLSNPMGKGSAAGYSRKNAITDLKRRYADLMKKARRHWKLSVFTEKDSYYFVFKVPSETYYEQGLEYDVVIQFVPIGNSKNNQTLNNYAIKLFSNAPNFMFTYAYLYNQDDIIIDCLKSKLSERSLTEKPDVRNPNLSYGFEKSVYFALTYIIEHGFTKKNSLRLISFNTDRLKRSIKDADTKLAEYNKYHKKVVDKNKAKRAKAKKKEETKQKVMKVIRFGKNPTENPYKYSTVKKKKKE